MGLHLVSHIRCLPKLIDSCSTAVEAKCITPLALTWRTIPLRASSSGTRIRASSTARTFKMGGQAFSETLSTPRMPQDIYDQVLSATKCILRKHFTRVDSAIEGPGKETFGDIDLLAFGPLDPSFDAEVTPNTKVAMSFAKLLNAEKWVINKPSINFAIPWPSQAQDEEKKFIQLDIHVCRSEREMQWNLFHTAHGDLWNILGSTIRQFGLTVNDKGLHLRIPDIEKHDRKKSMVFLTDEPAQILEFLGLDPQKWWERFPNQDEMFEYATTCRLFWVKPIKIDGEAEGDVVTGDGAVEGQEGGDAGKKKLKHNDRQRLAKRPIFKDWIEIFIPKCREEGRLGNTTVTRAEVCDDACATFGVKDDYATRLRDWRIVKNREDVWAKAIKGVVPEDVDAQLRGAALKQLKRIILEGIEFDGSVPKAAEKDCDGCYNLEEVRMFVITNWKKAGELGLLRQQIRSQEIFNEKQKKIALEAESEHKKQKFNT